jgi:integrase
MSTAQSSSLLCDRLPEYLRRKFARIRSCKTVAHYDRAVRYFGEFLGRPAQLDDLDDDVVVDFLRYLLSEREQCEVTANTSRKCLVAFWRWCHLRGLVAVGPTVDKLPEPWNPPQCLNREQLAKLVDAARRTRGIRCGMPASEWWLLLFSLDWDTGARAGELLGLRWEWIDRDSWSISVPASVRKGRMRGAVYHFTPRTIGMLRRHWKSEGPILGYAPNRNPAAYYLWWDKLLRLAGLPADRKHKTQSLRRSFATWLKIGGGDASAALLHTDQRLAAAHYLDASLSAERHADKLPFHLLDL